MTGRQVGHYELRGLLGVGGMGEVYRAFDPQLRREVAVKMLPPDLTGDPDRIARFEREARVLASLNHPNIATIYGVEQSSEIRGIVMELVEGETLAERLAEMGRLAVAEVLAVARQVADALDAAHEKGIVHRDLKPANIKITPQGTVKVLDFGLATVERSNDAHAATALPGATREGTILGTVAYMSPEQARGQAVDKRTDVWAFGCILYEMLTGRATFAGDTPSDISAAILSRQPDWSALPAATPAGLRRLLSRCLDKDARRRLRDIGDARTDIEDMLSGGTAGASSTSTPAGTMATAFVREKRGRFILATALVLAAVVGFVLLRPPAAPETFRQNEMNPPSGHSFAPLMEGGAPALSPDGSMIAFVAQGSAGRSLWVQSVDAFDARSLTGTDGAAAPFWSPNGDELAFFADGNLKTVKLDGGAPRVLVTGVQFTSQGALPGTWNRDGTILFRHQNQALWSVSARGGEPTVATKRDAALMEQDHYGAFFLPDGRHFIVLVRKGAELRLQVALGELDSSSRTPLVDDVTNAQYAPGRNGRSSHLLFVRGGRLIARPFDDEELKLTGSEVTLAEDVGVTLGGGLGDFSVSAAGVIAYRHAAAGSQADMAWYDRSGERVGTIGDRRGHPRNIIRISPSGESAVFTRQGPVTQEVWIANVASGHTLQLTSNGRTPVWSPDGSEIAFLRQDQNESSDPPTFTIYRKKVDGGEDVPVWSRSNVMAINDWSGDGQYLLLTIFDTTNSLADAWLLRDPLGSSMTPEVVPFETAGQLHPSFVPSEGPPLAISADGVTVFGMPGAKPGPWRVGSEGAFHARWRADGQELFFHDEGYLHVVERMDSATDFRFVGQPQRLFPLPFAFRIAQGQMATGWDVTPDGQRFLVVNPPPDSPGSIQIVTNWDVE